MAFRRLCQTWFARGAVCGADPAMVLASRSGVPECRKPAKSSNIAPSISCDGHAFLLRCISAFPSFSSHGATQHSPQDDALLRPRPNGAALSASAHQLLLVHQGVLLQLAHHHVVLRGLRDRPRDDRRPQPRRRRHLRAARDCRQQLDPLVRRRAPVLRRLQRPVRHHHLDEDAAVPHRRCRHRGRQPVGRD